MYQDRPHNKPIFPWDFNIPKIEVPSFEDLRNKAQESLKNPTPEVDQAKSFYERNKPLILTVVGTVVLYKIEKRMVKKVVAKAVQKDTLIVKEHLNQLTMAVEDLASFAYDKRYAADTFLRGVADTQR